MNPELPSPPKSWTELTWQRLCDCWQIKLRYGGNADVARVAALVALLQLKIDNGKLKINYHPTTGERLYYLLNPESCVCTPRELSWMAKKAIPWFDYPYGDPGEKEEVDEKGNVIKEHREGIQGYVSQNNDAMSPPVDYIAIAHGRAKEKGRWYHRHFELPQWALLNTEWQVYRTLQNIVPQIFADGVTDEQLVELRAMFLAHILVPRSLAVFDTEGGSIKFRPHWTYVYSSERAEQMVNYWKKQPCAELLFCTCFQIYQTSQTYYSRAFPLLYEGGGKQKFDALVAEMESVNGLQKYSGAPDAQSVYKMNVPTALAWLNTMAKEAKEIEKMNAKMKRK